MNIHELDIFQLSELKNIVKSARDLYAMKIRDSGVKDMENSYLSPDQQESYDLFKKHNTSLLKLECLLNYKLLNEIVYE